MNQLTAYYEKTKNNKIEAYFMGHIEQALSN